MSEDKYTPLSEVQFNEMVEILDSITTHIPSHLAGYVWGNYKLLTKSKEPQPCTCGSSAGHWRKAVEALRTWVNERK